MDVPKSSVTTLPLCSFPSPYIFLRQRFARNISWNRDNDRNFGRARRGIIYRRRIRCELKTVPFSSARSEIRDQALGIISRSFSSASRTQYLLTWSSGRAWSCLPAGHDRKRTMIRGRPTRRPVKNKRDGANAKIFLRFVYLHAVCDSRSDYRIELRGYKAGGRGLSARSMMIFLPRSAHGLAFPAKRSSTPLYDARLSLLTRPLPRQEQPCLVPANYASDYRGY